MLDKLPKEELIENLIIIFETVCNDDEKLRDLTHLIVTEIQVREILMGRSDIKDYEEPHRSELKKRLDEENRKGCVIE
jgi:hypothetical protein